MADENLRAVASLLKAGFTPESAALAVAYSNPGALCTARCNDDRVLRFDSRERLTETFERLVREYKDDPDPFRVSRALGDERIDFRNGVSILFREKHPYRRHGQGDVTLIADLIDPEESPHV